MKKKFIVVDTMYNDGSWICNTKDDVMMSCGEDLNEMTWKEFISTTEYEVIEITGKIKYLTAH